MTADIPAVPELGLGRSLLDSIVEIDRQIDGFEADIRSADEMTCVPALREHLSYLREVRGSIIVRLNVRSDAPAGQGSSQERLSA